MARTAGRSALRLVEGYRAPPTKIGVPDVCPQWFGKRGEVAKRPLGRSTDGTDNAH
jgi:hypothetical protein